MNAEAHSPAELLRFPAPPDSCCQLLDCAREVHAALGPGLPPLFYARALAIELASRGISYERDRWFDLRFRGSSLGRVHFDLLLDDLAAAILCESKIAELEVRRLRAAVRAAERSQGLVLNFGCEELQVRRVAAER